MKPIDKFLNSITMYRLLLYGLSLIAIISIIFSFFGLVGFGGLQLFASVFTLIFSCYFTNLLFAKIFKAARNTESAAITGLILFFVAAPITSITDLPWLILVAALAMLSKYVLAINKKHLFNPAAVGSLIIILAGGSISFWWVATPPLLPFVAIIGFLIVRKIRRFALFSAFFISALASISVFGLINQVDLLSLLYQTILSGPIIFFGTFMLTEPLTTPPTKKLQIFYGLIVGLLFGAQFDVGPIYSSPELALIIGNLFSYIVSPKQKLLLKFHEKIQLTPEIFEFIFTPNQHLNFYAGQYLEWTLPHSNPDDRGNRRYFTIASSPTEKDIKLGIRIQPEGHSSFKKALHELKKDDIIMGSQLAGEFTLPREENQKLAFIAGGIGITPFRSMIKYLIDTKQKRDLTIFYAAPHTDSFAYQEIFETAAKHLDIKVIYTITRANHVPPHWKGETGYLTAEMIAKHLPDYKDRMFYLSGPESMVNSYKEILSTMNLNHKNLMIDYFPGF